MRQLTIGTSIVPLLDRGPLHLTDNHPLSWPFDTAHLLASKGVPTMEDLAELAVDELVELTNMDAERAKTLIMTAREPWFK